MKQKVWSLILIGLLGLQAQGQSCCTGGGASNVSIGGSSESLIMPHKAIGIEAQHLSWFLKPYKTIALNDNSLVDVNMVNATALGLHYGLLDKLSLSVVLPYVGIQSEVFSVGETGIIKDKTNSQGFGDMSLMVNFKSPLKKVPLKSWAFMLGFELPTGYTSLDQSNIIASLGSGSWDPIFGLGYQKKTEDKRFAFTARSVYKLTTMNADELDLGDFWNTNLIGTYHLKPKVWLDTCCEKETTLNKAVSLGLSHDHLAPMLDHNGEAMSDTGYDRYYASIGTSLEYERFRFSLFGDLPVYERIEGLQNNGRFRLRASLLVSFNH